MAGASYGFRVYSKPSLEEIARAAERANKDLQPTFRDMLRNLGRKFVQLAGEEARGGPEGTIAKGIFFRTYTTGGLISELRVYPGTIGSYHLYGTGIYGPAGRRIYPISAKALKWNNGTEIVYAASTKGVKPDKFFGRAYRRWLPGAKAELRAVSQTWVRNLAGQNQGINF